MEDAINTGAWQQPNTFMDIMSPRKSASPRSTPAKSATLMRTAVRKPELQPEPAALQAQPLPVVSAPVEEPEHQEAMRLTDQSPLISRFTSNAGYPQETVEPQQPLSMASMEQPASSNLQAMMSSSMDGAPVVSQVDETAYEQVSQPMQASVAEAAIVQPGFNIFSQAPAFESAGYNQSAKKIRRPSLRAIKRLSGWSVVGIVLIGLIGGGIYVSRNFSTLELYLASSRAGFSATLPGTRPSGYALSGISTASGIMEASFKSSTGGRNYTISEKKSSLSSSSILAGYVTNQAGLNYQTVTSGNLTIYIYNNHDATWVNNGVWYVIQDNNSLSDHQIINIADTM